MRTIGRWAGAAALALAGCGTQNVVLPRNNRLTPGDAVPVIERTVKLNALKQAPQVAPAGQRQVWADGEGWYVPEEGRLAKLYYADIESVTRTYAQGGDVAASACVAGLMGPFSAAYVEVTMKNGKVWRMETDPGGDPAVCLNCAPFWLITFPRPMRKTRLIGLSFETMRVHAGVSASGP